MRSGYMSVMLYLFATLLLVIGFSYQFTADSRFGVPLLCIGFFVVTIVNINNLVAHLNDNRPVRKSDAQLGLTISLFQAVGSLLSFVGILFLTFWSNKTYVSAGLGIFGSLLMFIGGLIKILTSRMEHGLPLEKLQEAQEKLIKPSPVTSGNDVSINI